MVKTKDLDKLIKAKKLQKQERFNKLNREETRGNYHIRGQGKANLIYMGDDGIKTETGLDIPYNKIVNILIKKNALGTKIVAFGATGAIMGREDKTVEITHNNGKIVINDVDPHDAIKFVDAVKQKVFAQ